MPGWYIHMDVARKALADLAVNRGAAPLFEGNGPRAADLTTLARNNPAYAALGAIGPDIFFLLPDFKPPAGAMLFGASNTIREIYQWWDENFLGPWQDQMSPIEDNLADEVDAVTGGLASQLSSLLSRAFSFLLDTIAVHAVRQYDVFGLLGSGVQSAYDEQTFFWSDMLHYRKTYWFAAHLWKKANDAGNDRFKAFALGWMSHLATDVAGHCFVNEKSGGPYRLHWQRHHLVENHMDGKVYDSEHGIANIYNMLSNSALHLWIAFNPDGTSHSDFFQAQPGPDYPTGDKTPDQLARHAAWDVDSDIPSDLGDFIAEALREVYSASVTDTDGEKRQCAAHPVIWDAIVPGSGGYIQGADVVNTYWWLYHYVKWTTTDYYQLCRPDPPSVINLPPFPSPPGSGSSDAGPGPSDSSDWQNALELLLSIFAWISYLAEVASWPTAAIVSLFTSAGTYPVRELIYDNLELPVYNAWLAMHWYLAMSGFVYPMQEEVNLGLTTLGFGVSDVWRAVQDALDDLDGAIVPPAAPGENSGADLDLAFPIDTVTDPAPVLRSLIHQAVTGCGQNELPSEFLRPWLWPEKDNEHDPVPSESKLVQASPFHSMQDCTAIMGGMPGHAGARHQYESAQSEGQTIQASHDHLPHGETLGDAVDYSAYLVACLTRNNLQPQELANFNLDSDRGYGYLCWDWLRYGDAFGAPRKLPNATYNLPIHPGTGWCKDDVVVAPQASNPGPAVAIRYIDREKKFL